jgi:hypothetical protein
MADPNRRFRLAAVTLPLLFLAMSGLARATLITVDTTDDGSVLSHCTLIDAVTAANSHGVVNACPAGSGSDTIKFSVAGTIILDGELAISDASLSIVGPDIGGITIDGDALGRIINHSAGTLTVKNLTFTNGSAIEGGAIFESGTSLTIQNCTFNNNTAQPSLVAGGNGGAIFGNSAATIDIINSTFANNTAAHRGDPTVHNSGTDGFGGAIFMDQSGSVTKFTNVTFSGNIADADGAYDLFPQPSIKSTIFANNAGGNCAGTPTDDGFNISDDASCSFSPALTSNNTPLQLDPMGLQNNGGPTKTIALQASSPAINRITPITSCTDQSSNPITTDQRLFARPDFGNLNTCDSGAYEFGALPPVVLNSHTVQISRATIPPNDKVNLALNFTKNPDGDNDCDFDDDALHAGVDVELFPGSCANLNTATGLDILMSPFAVHTIGSQTYGTFFLSTPPKTVSAKIVTQATPPGACGRWSLNVAVTGINSSNLGNGPFAMLIGDNADNEGCFDITDALVGNQITKPAHGVRRARR